MLNPDGIEVILRPAGSSHGESEACPEHKMHKDQKDEPNSMERYVESVAGQQFEIVLKVHPNFKIEGADALRLRWSYDKGPQWGMTAGVRVSTSGPSELISVDSLAYSHGEQWKYGKLVFGERSVDPQIFYHDKEDLEEATNHKGRIDIAVIPGTAAWGTSGTFPQKRPNLEQVERVDESIKLVNGKGVGHYVKTKDDRDLNKDPDKPRLIHKPLKGEAGAIRKFTFLYRTHDWLERNSILPWKNQTSGYDTATAINLDPAPATDVDTATAVNTDTASTIDVEIVAANVINVGTASTDEVGPKREATVKREATDQKGMPAKRARGKRLTLAQKHDDSMETLRLQASMKASQARIESDKARQLELQLEIMRAQASGLRLPSNLFQGGKDD